jgi:hypothetical protein
MYSYWIDSQYIVDYMLKAHGSTIGGQAGLGNSHEMTIHFTEWSVNLADL